MSIPIIQEDCAGFFIRLDVINETWFLPLDKAIMLYERDSALDSRENGIKEFVWQCRWSTLFPYLRQINPAEIDRAKIYDEGQASVAVARETPPKISLQIVRDDNRGVVSLERGENCEP